MIQIAAAIENHLLDALLFGAIGNGLADELCAGQIPAADFRVFRFGAFTLSAALFGVGLGALFGVALGALFSLALGALFTALGCLFRSTGLWSNPGVTLDGGTLYGVRLASLSLGALFGVSLGSLRLGRLRRRTFGSGALRSRAVFNESSR